MLPVDDQPCNGNGEHQYECGEMLHISIIADPPGSIMVKGLAFYPGYTYSTYQ